MIDLYRDSIPKEFLMITNHDDGSKNVATDVCSWCEQCGVKATFVELIDKVVNPFTFVSSTLVLWSVPDPEHRTLFRLRWGGK